MRKLWLLIFVSASCAWATSYPVTAVRVDGAPAGACTGTGTVASGVLTAVSGCTFTSGMVGNGIVYNGTMYTISAYTSGIAVTLSSSFTQASTDAWTVMLSACPSSTLTTNSDGTCNGWVAEVDISTVATGGTYTLGLGTNNSVSAAAIVFTVTSPGYQSPAQGGTCGSTTTYTRLVYATHVLRQPYPNPSVHDEISSGGTFTTRLALSAPIYASDTVTVAIAAGFYTDGSGNTNTAIGAGGTVTNGSTLPYSMARALFNWTYPGWQRIAGSTFTVRGTGFSQYPQNELPLSCVVYTVTDAHSHTVTSTVTYPTIDRTFGDPNPIVEYIGTIATGTFTNHDQLTINFKAYPWIGDSTATMDSSDGTYAQPTPLYAPEYDLLDTTNNFSAAAYVDPSQNIPGALTTGTCTVGEQMKQTTSNAIVYLIAGNSTNLHAGATVSGTVNATELWTGQTSGCTFTPTAVGTFVGVDTASCAVAESAWNYGSPPAACRTVNGGLVKMAAYNNASSTPTHNDACGTLYVETNGTGNSTFMNWMGASGAASNTTGKCWANIVPVNNGTLVIDQQTGSQSFGTACTSGSTNCGTPIHLQNTTVAVTTGPTSVFNTNTYLWLDHDILGATGTAPIYQVTDVYMTENSFTNVLVQGLRPFSTTNTSYVLLRGNNLSNVMQGDLAYVYTVVGNTNTVSQACFMDNEFSSQGNPLSIMVIFAFNTMYKCNNTGNALLSLNLSTSGIIGAAVVQNVFENNAASDAVAMAGYSNDSSTGTPVNNLMDWDNVYAGGRENYSYNDSGSTVLFRQGWSQIGDIIDDVAIKTDTFNGTPQGGRIGNWGEVYGSGNRSTVYASTAYNVDAGDFCKEFWGINSYGPAITAGATQPPTCTHTNAANFPQYHSRLAYAGSGATAGGGDYRLNSNSPAINFFSSGRNILPYDLAGQIRNNSGWGSAGAYEQSIAQTTGGALAF